MTYRVEMLTPYMAHHSRPLWQGWLAKLANEMDADVGLMDQAVITGQIVLFLLFDGTECRGFIGCSIEGDQRGRGVVCIDWCAGEGLKSIVACVPEIHRWARAIGVERGRVRGAREGWQRALAPLGYEPAHVVLECDLTAGALRDTPAE